MSETKIQLNERKIRNGIRNSVKAQQKQMWDKLSTEVKPEPVEYFDSRITPLVTLGELRNSCHPTELVGNKFDKVIIDEWIEK